MTPWVHGTPHQHHTLLVQGEKNTSSPKQSYQDNSKLNGNNAIESAQKITHRNKSAIELAHSNMFYAT